jgi:hypothetical protein
VCLQYTVHVVTIYGIDAVANEIDVVLKKNSPGNENTRFYLTKTKQSGYYLNLFHESNLLSYLCWLTHPGLNVSALTFKSRDQYIL